MALERVEIHSKLPIWRTPIATILATLSPRYQRLAHMDDLAIVVCVDSVCAERLKIAVAAVAGATIVRSRAVGEDLDVTQVEECAP